MTLHSLLWKGTSLPWKDGDYIPSRSQLKDTTAEQIDSCLWDREEGKALWHGALHHQLQ